MCFGQEKFLYVCCERANRHSHVSRKTKISYHVIINDVSCSLACMNTNCNRVENYHKTTFHSSLKLKTFKGNHIIRRKKPEQFTFPLCAGQNTSVKRSRPRKYWNFITPRHFTSFHFKHVPNGRFFSFLARRILWDEWQAFRIREKT